jgi:hypothetical protein
MVKDDFIIGTREESVDLGLKLNNHHINNMD